MSDIAFTWKIQHWEFVPKLNGFTNVITRVNWMLTATDDEGRIAKASSSIKLPVPTKGEPYTAKEDVTQDQLIEWIKPLMGYEKYVENLTNHLCQEAAADTRPIAEVPVFKDVTPKTATPIPDPAPIPAAAPEASKV